MLKRCLILFALAHCVHGFATQTRLSYSTVLDTGIEESLNEEQPDRRPDRLDRQSGSKGPTHVVEHIELLNNPRFWWLMGSLVVCVGVAVLTLEAHPLTNPSKEDVTDEGSFSRKITHLCVCVVALWVAMILWGVAQEYVMTATFRGPHGIQESFPSAFFLVLCNRTLTALITAITLMARGSPMMFPGFGETVAPAISNIGSSWFQYASLAYISFTLQTTVKSAKLLPVMFLGTLRGKAYTMQDYAEGIVIAVAIGVFGLETEGHSSDASSTGYGVAMLVGYVACDSATPHFQDMIFQRHPSMDALQATFAAACTSVGMLLCGLFVTGSFMDSAAFLSRHPGMLLPLAILACSSCLTQVLVNHTIKHFGPLLFTLVQCTRQLMSVLLSTVLFMHAISPTAWLAVMIAFMALIARSLRHMPIPAALAESLPFVSSQQQQNREGERQDDSEPSTEASSEDRVALLSARLGSLSLTGSHSHNVLIICAIGIHANYCLYGVAQEFLATHTFGGQIFSYPMFLVAVDHSLAACLALFAMFIHGGSLTPSGWAWTAWPAATDLAATWMQHQALYMIFFPAHTLMKTLKVVPVMLVGSCLKNRSYTWKDYLEGLLLTMLVGYFVWDFQIMKAGGDAFGNTGFEGISAFGVLLMLGYVVVDSFTSNLEDFVFLRTNLDASHVLLGMEAVSGAIAWLVIWATGEFRGIATFIGDHPEVVAYVLFLGMAAAGGAYTCTVSVRLLGPAVFTLLMMSRQVCSLLISVLVYQHGVSTLHCFCMAAIAVLILASSARRVSAVKQS
mmetsp:Transcript_43643/g.79586  ORF Transcript_43643/g.79586 Transcript_43643/m.79586 type:complete len:791 (+) Transcript_43643:125-2497(+)